MSRLQFSPFRHVALVVVSLLTVLHVSNTVVAGTTLIKLDGTKGVLISTPPDGWYENTSYRGSGKRIADALRAAFSSWASRVDVVTTCHGDDCLATIDPEKYGYYVKPDLLHWGEETGPSAKGAIEPGQTEMQLVIYDTATKKELANTTYTERMWPIGPFLYVNSLYQSDSEELTGEQLEFWLSSEDAGSIAQDSGDSESLKEINEFAGLFKTVSDKLNEASCTEPTEDNPNGSPYILFSTGGLRLAGSLRWAGLVRGILPSSSPDNCPVTLTLTEMTAVENRIIITEKTYTGSFDFSEKYGKCDDARSEVRKTRIEEMTCTSLRKLVLEPGNSDVARNWQRFVELDDCRLGNSYYEHAEYDKSVSSLNLCLKLQLGSSKRALLYRTRADALSHIGKPELAVQDQLKSIELESPSDLWPYIGLSFYYRESKAYDLALKAIEKAKEYDEDGSGWPIYYHMGRTLYDAGRYREAVKAYKRGIRKRRDHGFAYFRRALAYEALNKKHKARADFVSAKKYIPIEHYDEEVTRKFKEYGLLK